MPLEIIESKRKCPVVIVDGFIFHFAKNGHDKKIWECSERKNKRCRVRIHTTDSSSNLELLHQVESHTHEPDPAKIDKIKMAKKVKKKTTKSCETKKLIIVKNYKGMPSVPLKLVESKIGKHPVIVKDGFIFHFSKNGIGKKIWECSKRKARKCNVRIHTTDNIKKLELLIEVGSHTHEPTKIDNINVVEKVMKVTTNSHATRNLITRNNQGMQPASKATMPLVQNITQLNRRCLQRKVKRCTIGIHTADSNSDLNLLNDVGSHTHEPDPDKIDVIKVVENVNNDDTNSQETSKLIIARNNQGILSANIIKPLVQNISQMNRRYSERKLRRCHVGTTETSSNLELLNEVGSHELDPDKIDTIKVMENVKNDDSNTPENSTLNNQGILSASTDMPLEQNTSLINRKVPLELIESKLGKRPVLAMDGFKFHFSKNGRGKKIWECSKRKAKRCHVRIHTTNSSRNPELLIEVGSHTHECSPTKIGKIKVVKKEKKKATNSLKTTKVVIDRDIKHTPSASKDIMPLVQNISWMNRKMLLEVIESNSGKHPLIAMDGYMFHFSKNGRDKKIWECSERKMRRCHVRIHTTDCGKNSQLLSVVGSHTHEPSPAKVDIKKVMENVKKDATSSHEKTNVIIERNIQGMSPASKALLPQVPSISRLIRKVRAGEEGSLLIPHKSEEMNLPLSYMQTNKKEDFILFDSGPSSDRIIIFGTKENLTFLGTCITWMLDGSFKVAPSPFDQLFVIHGLREGVTIPLLYCLVPDRTMETYDRTITAIKHLNENLQPTTIVSDFDLASSNAFSAQFPNCEMKGCLFHFRRCLYHQIQLRPDIFHAYSNNSDFKLMLCHFAALVLVPPEDVVTVYKTLMETEFFTTNEELLTNYMQYFEGNWVGTLNRRQTAIIPPRYPINTWNCFYSVLDDLPRTNNACEGFHNGFNEILCCSHSTIYKLINAMKMQQTLTELKIQQALNGNTAAPNQKYADLGLEIKFAVQNYAEQDPLEYLGFISRLILELDSLPISEEHRVMA